jgi:hypothetical protein
MCIFEDQIKACWRLLPYGLLDGRMQRKRLSISPGGGGGGAEGAAHGAYSSLASLAPRNLIKSKQSRTRSIIDLDLNQAGSKGTGPGKHRRENGNMGGSMRV